MPELVLGANECRVWWADPRNRSEETLAEVLNEHERARAERYLHEEDRRRFLTACWLLRTKAAAQLGTEPEDVPVDRSCPDCGKPHGKPRIRSGGKEDLHVSVSHSAERIAVALTSVAPVGVDVEQIPDVPIRELAGSALSPGERAVLGWMPPHHQHAAFTRMWVCKEAALKATGHGLRIPPDQVHVSHPDMPPALLAWPLGIPPSTVGLQVLDAGPGYRAVVALLSPEPTTVTQRYEDRFLTPTLERQAA
ncbi:4'-phosphopantetheinyl transferase family protein [Nonomuraea jiangxiensis]|uniref:4'-phosphopantetheinyl transferase n=1 Tax=Nonomuraea jiangxiensis TaxID=633440 RepID=A0A1G8IK30_9ACTN|nr:4'-phosphopantetheinyl transferase superfamily protein [Nonomuraea jiangxiensis]SDI19264.1 4'-phosphopantetheinyl transferase [Nonomuraea jiangxiensis]